MIDQLIDCFVDWLANWYFDRLITLFVTDECASQPCMNGGRCIDIVGGYRCECPPGYGGSACQADIDECASNPCRNGATCLDVVNGYRCTCRLGFSGATCQTASIVQSTCNVNPCEHGGRCVDVERGFECVCNPGYSGTLCEVSASG